MRQIFFWATLLFFSAMLGLGAFVSWRLHASAIANGLEISEMHTRSFEDFLTQNIRIVELAVTNSIPQEPGPASLRNIKSAFIKTLHQTPIMRSMSLLDEHGKIIVSSNPANIGLRVTTEEYLPIGNPQQQLLRIGHPWAGRDFAGGRETTPQEPVGAEEQSFIPIKQSLMLGDRHITVLVALNPDYVVNHMQHKIDANDGGAEVILYDGTLLIDSDPSSRAGILSDDVIRGFHLSEIESGRYEKDLGTGEKDLISFRASRLYPIVVVTHIHREHALQQWLSEVKTLLAVVIPALLSVSLISFAYYRRQNQIAEQRIESERIQRINATVFDASAESITITDANTNIISVNNAFVRNTGFLPEEVIGRNPRILSSGQQDKGFYRHMWAKLLKEGFWEGELINRNKDGKLRNVHLSISASRDSAGTLQHYIGVTADITERKRSETEIHNLAFYDTLTSLPNRRMLIDRLKASLSASARNQHFGGLLFVDMDNFKTLNDTLGHEYGDLLLIEVAKRIKSCVREMDTVARVGGDDFIVLLEDVDANIGHASQKIALIAEKIRASLTATYQLNNNEYLISSSIGVSIFHGEELTINDLLKHAEMAMYRAKESGRNAVCLFDPAMQLATEARAALEADLRRAVQGQQLQLYYQIQVDNDRNPIGAEALVRWIHPARGMISPAQFIPLAEESSLILDIGEWVLDTACRQLAAWSKMERTRHFVLAVNVSGRQFKQADFVKKVAGILHAHGVDASRLKLELTESVVLNDVTDVVRKMHALKALRVRLSMDDFGTGYSSLSNLKQLPLDQIKIDQSFVRDMTFDQNDVVMVQTIIDMAKNFRLNVIAEGVETEAQQLLLKELGCMAYQGYLFSKPVPIEQFEALLKN
ncbi:MAG: EAL domain-containing protein [Gallionellaceae bacterium]|jgi:diguanylate cyclase (GGDEF)-like protein/PAS domain S-box-containing protein